MKYTDFIETTFTMVCTNAHWYKDEPCPNQASSREWVFKDFNSDGLIEYPHRAICGACEAMLVFSKISEKCHPDAAIWRYRRDQYRHDRNAVENIDTVNNDGSADAFVGVFKVRHPEDAQVIYERKVEPE